MSCDSFVNRSFLASLCQFACTWVLRGWGCKSSHQMYNSNNHRGRNTYRIISQHVSIVYCSLPFSKVMYFFPIVFIAGPVNNGPVTACALLARHLEDLDCRRSCEGFNVPQWTTTTSSPSTCIGHVISSVVHERVESRMWKTFCW